MTVRLYFRSTVALPHHTARAQLAVWWRRGGPANFQADAPIHPIVPCTGPTRSLPRPGSSSRPSSTASRASNSSYATRCRRSLTFTIARPSSQECLLSESLTGRSGEYIVVGRRVEVDLLTSLAQDPQCWRGWLLGCLRGFQSADTPSYSSSSLRSRQSQGAMRSSRCRCARIDAWSSALTT